MSAIHQFPHGTYTGEHFHGGHQKFVGLQVLGLLCTIDYQQNTHAIVRAPVDPVAVPSSGSNARALRGLITYICL